MQAPEHRSDLDRFELVASEHGGYHRHTFVDHTYLYNLYFPPEALFTSLREQIHDLVRNYPVAQHVLARLAGDIIGQPAERIVVGNGASELIKILAGSMSSRLIIPVPSFNEYANAAPPGKVTEYPLAFPSFQLDIDRFAAEAIRIGADVAIVVTPNNPTSLLVPKADLVRLAGLLAPHDCMLVIDESFVDFAAHPDQATLERDISRYPNMAICKSMSKAYGICGLRLGYVLTCNARFAAALRKGLHIWNVNGLAEQVLRLLPRYKSDFLDSCVLVRADRDGLYDMVSRIQGMTVLEPDANFVYCRLPDHAPDGPEVAQRLFVEHDIYVKHCAGKSQPDSHRYLRIGSRTESENRQLVEALVDVMA